ncbi:MAG: carbohydrate ABC transporter permease [Candidatus Acetothermia bacterium]
MDIGKVFEKIASYIGYEEGRKLKQASFWKESFWAYVYLLPTLAVLGTFSFWPLIRSFKISLFDWNILTDTGEFIGFQNYAQLFADPEFGAALWHTVYYALVSTPVTMIIALFIAVLLNREIRFRGWFRTAFFLPWITPMVAGASVFVWLFNADYGLVNYVLSQVGLGNYRWLNNPSLAIPLLIIFGVWKFLGFQVVLFVAGLQNIPQHYYEAAKVDGANRLQLFRHVTLPLLTPTTFFVLIISMIGAFKVFTQVYVLWAGTAGPLNSAQTIVMFFFEKGFNDFQFGYASASAYILFLIVFVLTAINMRLSKRWVHYQ